MAAPWPNTILTLVLSQLVSCLPLYPLTNVHARQTLCGPVTVCVIGPHQAERPWESEHPKYRSSTVCLYTASCIIWLKIHHAVLCLSKFIPILPKSLGHVWSLSTFWPASVGNSRGVWFVVSASGHISVLRVFAPLPLSRRLGRPTECLLIHPNLRAVIGQFRPGQH